MSFHLFTARELKDLFSPLFGIESLCGLDIFHSRFMPDRRWNPVSLSLHEPLMHQLTRLEETYATDPNFMERATHLLLIGRRELRPEIDSVRAIKEPDNGYRGSLPPAR